MSFHVNSQGVHLVDMSTATHHNTPQHTATHRNTPQHTATRTAARIAAHAAIHTVNSCLFTVWFDLEYILIYYTRKLYGGVY